MASSADSGADSGASGDEGASATAGAGSGRSRRAPPGAEAAAAAGAVSDADADATDSDLEFSDDEDEDDQWQQYREVDAAQDDDRDELEALVPEKRYALPADVRQEARPAAEAPVGDEDADEGAPPELAAEDAKRRAMAGEMPLMAPDGSRIPLRNLYEEQLNEYAERVSGLKSELYGRAGRRLSRRERSSRMLEALNDPDMQLPGAPTAGKVIERGPRQLEALTQGSEWCLTIVDIKMTSTQTPQGKTQRYSAMVIVGNLKGKGAYGIGASKDMNTAIFKAVRFAILGAINIPLYRGHTVYFPSQTKYVRTKISIWPRPADFGITASPIIMEACELLGIRDISVKTHNSRNIRNVVKGFFQAIANIPTAAEVAEAKGCYMREVVYPRISPKRIL